MAQRLALAVLAVTGMDSSVDMMITMVSTAYAG